MKVCREMGTKCEDWEMEREREREKGTRGLCGLRRDEQGVTHRMARG